MSWRGLIALLLLVCAFGCGKSPLFNHKRESPKQQPATSQTNEERPLPNESLELIWSWVEGPFTPEKSKLLITIYIPPALEDKLSDLSLQAELWMPTMGHGSAPVTIRKIPEEKDFFEVDDIYFIMPGLWEIKVSILKEDKVIKEKVISLEL